jgi:hypothetical protein
VVSRGQPVRIERYITLITLGLGDDVGLAKRDRITKRKVILHVLAVPLPFVSMFLHQDPVINCC